MCGAGPMKGASTEERAGALRTTSTFDLEASNAFRNGRVIHERRLIQNPIPPPSCSAHAPLHPPRDDERQTADGGRKKKIIDLGERDVRLTDGPERTARRVSRRQDVAACGPAARYGGGVNGSQDIVKRSVKELEV
ncbi:hypothetical protein EYF80_029157 [Liparis tanakae]|uniref:Uncharacterized protein n=1 Tax=Liparis tanakae TaxID=230148 RepID=A0A4Z2H421_9TELE|nr:hypothetical protein EYF80_029157 [Liparis tanakae]